MINIAPKTHLLYDQGGNTWTTEAPAANQAPTVSNPIPNQSATNGSLFTYQFPSNVFSDSDGDTLTYSAALVGGGALPGWLSFSSSTRTFSGTPSSDGTTSVRVTASDGSLAVYDDFDITVSASTSTLIAKADWSVHGLTPDTLPGYESTTTWFVFDSNTVGDTTLEKVGNYAKASYVDSSGTQTNCGATLFLASALDVYDVDLEFYARIPTATKNGCKFVKFFGVDTAGNYANFTFGLQYSGGQFTEISFGDGSNTSNDTANVIRLDGSNPEFIGRSFGAASVTTSSAFSWDANWHKFRMRARYNSGTSAGNEVADGIFRLEIDDVVRVNATNVFNRHPTTNIRRLDRIEWFGYNQNSSGAWEMDIRDIFVYKVT